MSKMRRRVSDKQLHRHENQIARWNWVIRSLQRALPFVRSELVELELSESLERLEAGKRDQIEWMHDDKEQARHGGAG